MIIISALYLTSNFTFEHRNTLHLIPTQNLILILIHHPIPNYNLYLAWL